MRVRVETRPALHDRGLRRDVHLAGSPREYTESPLARFWATAEDSRADAQEKIALIREQHRASKKPAVWSLSRLRRGAKP
jgi:hypothetical protein